MIIQVAGFSVQLNEINREVVLSQKVEPQKKSITEQLKQSRTEVSCTQPTSHTIITGIHIAITGS